jgi:HK97 family phage major capsid protein
MKELTQLRETLKQKRTLWKQAQAEWGEGEDRSLSGIKAFGEIDEDAKIKAIKDLHAEIETLDAKVAELEELTQLEIVQEKQVKRVDAPAIHPSPAKKEGADTPEERTKAVGGIIRTMVLAKRQGMSPMSYAKEYMKDDNLIKALSSSTAADGGVLVQGQYASDVIELLRAESVVRSLQPLMVPMDSGTFTMPKHTAGSASTWIGENQNVAKTQPAFGEVKLTAKKLAALVPISNDLLRRSVFNADAIVRDDLVGELATSSDAAFIRADGTGAAPKGLYYQALAAGRVAVNATVNLANVTTDLLGAIQRMLDANVKMRRAGWIFAPRTWTYLLSLRDGNGNFAFKPEMDGGKLFGFPYKVTTNIPTNLGSGTPNESEIYLADFADVVIGETTGVMLDVSSEAAYHDGSNVVAAFSLDQSVIRAIIEVDLGMRHAESVQVLTEVDWGA